MSNVQTWDYQASVERVKPMVVNWRNLTVELVDELYRAREELAARRTGKIDVANATWTNYCREIGIDRSTVHRWLERYEPEEHRLLEPEEVEERKRIADRAAQDAAVAQRKRIAEAIKTGTKPADWDTATEKAYQRELKEREERRGRVESAKEELYAEREAKRRKDEEHKAKCDTFWEATDDLMKAADLMAENSQKRREFKERIRLSQSGESDLFIEALMDYLDELEDDSRRIEACQNIIKVCRNIATELQRV